MELSETDQLQISMIVETHPLSSTKLQITLKFQVALEIPAALPLEESSNVGDLINLDNLVMEHTSIKARQF